MNSFVSMCASLLSSAPSSSVIVTHNRVSKTTYRNTGFGNNKPEFASFVLALMAFAELPIKLYQRKHKKRFETKTRILSTPHHADCSPRRMFIEITCLRWQRSPTATTTTPRFAPPTPKRSKVQRVVMRRKTNAQRQGRTSSHSFIAALECAEQRKCEFGDTILNEIRPIRVRLSCFVRSKTSKTKRRASFGRGAPRNSIAGVLATNAKSCRACGFVATSLSTTTHAKKIFVLC